MSAERGSSSGTTFVFSNFYQIYRQAKLQEASTQELAKALVLKPGMRTVEREDVPSLAQARVVSSEQSQGLKQWCERSEAKKELAQSLRVLRDSSKRLAYLMAEVDLILKRE
jgi:hypothetical protein